MATFIFQGIAGWGRELPDLSKNKNTPLAKKTQAMTPNTRPMSHISLRLRRALTEDGTKKRGRLTDNRSTQFQIYEHAINRFC